MSMFGSAGAGPSGIMQPQQPQQPHQQRRGGIDIGQLGAMILAAYQNPLGIQALQQRAQRQQAQDETKQRHVQREQDMGDRWSMWQRQQEYERANPPPRAPDAFDRSLEMGGITDPAQRQRLYRQRAMNLANPMQGVQVYNPETGATELRFIRPSMDGAPQALPADTPGWEPIEEEDGGAGPSGPRNFR